MIIICNNLNFFKLKIYFHALNVRSLAETVPTIIPLPDAWVTLEWSIAQTEYSFEFLLDQHPNDELKIK